MEVDTTEKGIASISDKLWSHEAAASTRPTITVVTFNAINVSLVLHLVSSVARKTSFRSRASISLASWHRYFLRSRCSLSWIDAKVLQHTSTYTAVQKYPDTCLSFTRCNLIANLFFVTVTRYDVIKFVVLLFCFISGSSSFDRIFIIIDTIYIRRLVTVNVGEIRSCIVSNLSHRILRAVACVHACEPRTRN